MTLKDIDDWIEREIGNRFPDDMDISVGQLRVRVAKLCFEVSDKVNIAVRYFDE
jgi:hypothetical protein